MAPTKDQQGRVEHHGNRCDESKCVSSGLSSNHNNSFTCYGDINGYYPMMCADGYLPRVLEEVPSTTDIDEALKLEVTFQYFTCCPPTLPNEAIVALHCTDPETLIIGDHEDKTDYIDIDIDIDTDITATLFCDHNHPFLRQMKSRRYFNEDEEIDKIESHLCCDSETTDTDANTEDFLSETECVPYHNEFYAQSEVKNSWGTIAAVTCHFPDGNNGFVVPRLLEQSDASPSSPLRYECCKLGESSPPFVQDKVFNLTIYPQILLSSLAVVSSTLIILALSIPLLRHLRQKRGTTSPTHLSMPFQLFASATNSKRLFPKPSFSEGYDDSENPDNSETSGADSVDAFIEMLRRNAMPVQSKFSTYNLYLVYLAIPDLFMNLYILGMYTIFASNTIFLPGLCEYVISEDGVSGCTSSGRIGVGAGFMLNSYFTANIYLNVIVVYEIFALLKDSKNFQRRDPPSIRKVTLQAVAVLLFSILVGILTYGADKAKENGNGELYSALSQVFVIAINYLLFTILPLGYLSSVCLLIWYRGLMPSTTGVTTMDRAMREVAWYFFRIVAIFFGCYLHLAYIYAASPPNSIALLLLAMQQILSTCMSMTKSDVRKQLIDLLTLSSCAKNDSQERTSQASSESVLKSTEIAPMDSIVE